jgi:hypothetical protein
MEVIVVSEDPWQKLRDLGGEEVTGREGETRVMFGFRRISKTDERAAEATGETAKEPEDGAGDERDRLQKLRDLGANVRLGREGETVALVGFRRIPKADESREDAASSPSEREAPGLTPPGPADRHAGQDCTRSQAL